MSAPFVQALGTVQSGIGAISPAWPAHLTDDIALLFVETANQACTLSTPAGFVEVTNSPQGTGTAGGTAATRLTVFWCRATSNSMATPTVADSGDHQVARIATFRGCIKTGRPWDVSTGGVLASASTAVSIAGATTAVSDCLVFCIVTNATDTATGQGSGWTNANLANFASDGSNSNTISGVGGGFSMQNGDFAGPGNYGTTTATLATSSAQAFMTIALRPPATPEEEYFIAPRPMADEGAVLVQL